MPPDATNNPQTLEQLIEISRQHLGLAVPAQAPRTRRRMLRSLIFAGTLGGLMGGVATASEAEQPPALAQQQINSDQ